MAKYKIAWLPGDGVGNDVMEAAKIVLDATSLDAEFVAGEVGWECWEKYGDPLPPETIGRRAIDRDDKGLEAGGEGLQKPDSQG